MSAVELEAQVMFSKVLKSMYFTVSRLVFCISITSFLIDKKSVTLASTWLVNKKQVFFNLSKDTAHIAIFIKLLSSWVA